MKKMISILATLFTINLLVSSNTPQQPEPRRSTEWYSVSWGKKGEEPKMTARHYNEIPNNQAPEEHTPESEATLSDATKQTEQKTAEAPGSKSTDV